MEDKCEHGYKDGEYCLMCDKPEYIKLLEFEHKSLQAENAKLRDELFQSEGGRIRQRSEIAKLKAKLEVAEKVLEWFENPDHAIGSNAEKIWKFHKIAQEALSTLREKESYE